MLHSLLVLALSGDCCCLLGSAGPGGGGGGGGGGVMVLMSLEMYRYTALRLSVRLASVDDGQLAPILLLLAA